MVGLATGGAGFIGNNFAFDWLWLLKELIVTLDNIMHSGNLRNLASIANVESHVFVKSDLASKTVSDHLAHSYHHTYILPVLTTNCSYNYGLYQFPKKLIPLCIHNVIAGKPLPICGDG